jgi:hypothetical protein
MDARSRQARAMEIYIDWIVVKFSNEDVCINALEISAVVCEGGEGRWSSATKASNLFTSYFDSDSVPYTAANGQGKILAVSSSTTTRQDKPSAGCGITSRLRGGKCIEQMTLKKISATQP